jgi:hypothetical protein
MPRKPARWLVPVATTLMLVVGAAPGNATQPVQEVFVNQGIFTLPDIACGTFTLTEQMVSERVETKTYLDRSGNPVKVATHANFFGVVTNSASGHTYRDHAAFTETENIPAGTTTVSGVSYHYVDSGRGQIYAEVGHKISVTTDGSVIFQAGQDDYVQTGEAGLCAALI